MCVSQHLSLGTPHLNVEGCLYPQNHIIGERVGIQGLRSIPSIPRSTYNVSQSLRHVHTLVPLGVDTMHASQYSAVTIKLLLWTSLLAHCTCTLALEQYWTNQRELHSFYLFPQMSSFSGGARESGGGVGNVTSKSSTEVLRSV